VNILKNIGKSMGTKQICFPLTYMENKKKNQLEPKLLLKMHLCSAEKEALTGLQQHESE